MGPNGLTLWVTVTPAGWPPGLYQVSLRALWKVAGQARERQVDTLVWRPPPR